MGKEKRKEARRHRDPTSAQFETIKDPSPLRPNLRWFWRRTNSGEGRYRSVWCENWAKDEFEILSLTEFDAFRHLCLRLGIPLEEKD